LAETAALGEKQELEKAKLDLSLKEEAVSQPKDKNGCCRCQAKDNRTI
jgi:hypothetical protein